MPRPAVSGYERLAQDAELSDSDDDDRESIMDYPGRVVSIQPHPPSMLSTPYGPLTPSHNGKPSKRLRSNSSGVDIKAINARLERWSHEIANKFKFKKGRSQQEHPPLEIVYSVFVPPEGTRPLTDASSVGLPPVAENTQFTHGQFEEIVESVRLAIRKGINPKLIKQGSSGSYFMRDSSGNVVGVFKPKDEEPYVSHPWAKFMFAKLFRQIWQAESENDEMAPSYSVSFLVLSIRIAKGLRLLFWPCSC
jgi:hypothetical protein